MADSLIDGNQPVTVTKEEIIAKWKDKPVEDLLNAKAEADLYVESLKTRFDDLSKDYLALRERDNTGAQLKELLDRLDNTKGNDSVTTPQDGVQPGITPEDIEKLVSAKLTAHQQAQRQNENFNQVQAKLRETYGPNYQAAYKQQLDTLGLTPEFADSLAKDHPSVFMKTFGLDAQPKQTPASLPRTTQRPSFQPNVQKRDYQYYQNLKKDNPRLYLDPKIAVQMHNDMMELGSDFGLPED